MDLHGRWLRRKVVNGLLRRAAAWLFVASVASVGGLCLLGVEPVLAAPWGILLAQLLVACQFAYRCFFGVLSHRALHDYLARRLFFRAESLAESDEDFHQTLGRLEFAPDARLVPEAVMGIESGGASGQLAGEPAAGYEVFCSPDRSTFVATANQGTTSLVLTALTDGRLLVSSDLLVLPHEGLLVNHQPGWSIDRLIDAHRKVVGVLAARGLETLPASPMIVLELLRIEQASYSALGTWIAPFLCLTGEAPWWQSAVGVSPGEVRRLAARSRPATPGRPVERLIRSNDTPGAVPAVQPVASAHHASPDACSSAPARERLNA